MLGAAAAIVARLSNSVIYWYADFVNRIDPVAATRLGVNALRLVVIERAELGDGRHTLAV